MKKVAVIGAGMMGSGIAYVSAAAGMEVILKDVSMAAAEKGKSYSNKVCDALIEKGKLSEAQKQDILSRIHPSIDPKAVKDCELVIETVIEDRKIKAQVTKESEEVISSQAVMASNTSTLPITSLAESSVRPERFIGLHFFSPVDKMPLVEIIAGKKTGPEAIAICQDYVKQIKKTAIVVNDGRGFYTSRVFTTFISEGISMLKEGIEPGTIEEAGKSAGMPVGPLAVADEVSLDLIFHIMKQTIEDVGMEKVDKNCYEVSEMFVHKLHRLGRKSGGGFYEYPPGERKFLWPKLKELFPPVKNQPAIEEVKDRLLYIQSLETARCLQEGILRSPKDGDIGSIMGWGFPAATGGTLSLIEKIGAHTFVKKSQDFAKRFGPRYNPPKWLLDKAR